MHRKVSKLLVALTFAASVAGGLLVFSPEPAQAQLFSAGNQADGICTCPIDYGNCVCKLIK